MLVAVDACTLQLQAWTDVDSCPGPYSDVHQIGIVL